MDGIINIYKEKGYTSFDVVAKLRGILHQRKIGHTGTLDPEATGVLPVCVGKATKVCGLLTDKDKAYHAVCQLGIVTDTQDMTGKCLEEHDFSGCTEERIVSAASTFVGKQQQIPPMYSALKVNGKKLYELAREGKTVERKPRDIEVYSLSVSEMNLEEGTFAMDIVCSKGTYIRTICHDLGQKLGCGACMKSLVRTRVSVFSLEEAKTLEEVQKIMDESPEDISSVLRSVDSLFMQYPAYKVVGDGIKRLANGNLLYNDHMTFLEKENTESAECPQGDETTATICRIYEEDGKFRALYQKEEDHYRVYKMF